MPGKNSKFAGKGRIAALWLVLLSGQYAFAAIDLRNASVERLENGLTVILLEDRNFPVVSTQMLYRVGARNESYGQTGIAHFLEHMAFRSSKNFPDTGLVSSIYAVGGEWHGYTWTDQTTYFATVPRERADLLLRIEADRMARLRIRKADMEAERGAVLAEMHMYENYPTSVLLDSVLFTSFLAHPYRNNTIGWESDIENLKYEEVVAFYEEHYQPANAVLAVVGDFDREHLRRRIQELFGGFESGEPTALPHTVEPVQEGERVVRVYADTPVKRFMIGYRAPAASHPDFAAFLVAQSVLGASSGVNFRQNDWGTPAGEGSLLEVVATDVTTWFPPSAQNYMFIVGGTIPAHQDEASLEQAIEDRMAGLRNRLLDEDDVTRAIQDVLDELVFDVATTEDAAHQLAFFDGLRALDSLLTLPQRVADVTPVDVQRVARDWLMPQRRTIGWHSPGAPAGDAMETAPSHGQEPRRTAVKDTPRPVDRKPVPLPEIRRLPGGLPVIVQVSDVSPSAWLQLVVEGDVVDAANVTPGNPAQGHSSLAWRFRPDELEETVALARRAMVSLAAPGDSGDHHSPDPETRLQQVFTALMSGEGEAETVRRPSPALIVVSGDVNADSAFNLIEENFADVQVPARAKNALPSFPEEDLAISVGRPIAQAQLGYIVAAPGPDDADAWRMLRYILSHDYEGRLGKEAISNRGLAYYIDSRYRSDGRTGWVTLAVGVDPYKLAALRTLLQAELERLQLDPPSEAEIEEARQHFVGRHRSSAQSNEELANSLVREWIWYGDLLTPDELALRLQKIDRKEVLDIVPAFVEGVTIAITP